jgi:hypothetical protein
LGEGLTTPTAKYQFVTNCYTGPEAWKSIIRVIISRRMIMTRMGEVRNAYKSLVGKPEGNRPLGRPRRRWENNVRMVHRVIRQKSVGWMHLVKDRGQWPALVNT